MRKLYSVSLTDGEKESLYSRGTAYSVTKNGVLLEKGGSVSFDTYFNSFSYSKYLRFTAVRKVFVSVRARGSLELRLMRAERGGDTELFSERFSFSDIETAVAEVDFSDFTGDGFVYPIISAEEKTEITEIGYYADESAFVREVRLALAICTFRREQYVYENMRRLSDGDFDRLGDSLSVIIVDNGGTLDSSLLPQELDISVFPNRNYGGSGGFTRGIIEACRSEKKPTHILLMDDDIQFTCQTVYRTVTFSECAEKEIRISAAMLPTDDASVQFEAGAKWTGGEIRHLKSGLKVSERDALFANNEEETPDYGAWWYFMMPLTVTENGLPFPFFIKTDDIEYGLRSRLDIVTQNGIGVWHEPFASKFSFYLTYYIKRNELVTNIFHCKRHKRAAVKKLIKSVGRVLVSYTYRSADFVFDAYKDFLSGVDFFLATDEEKLNNELRSRGIPLIKEAELNEKGVYITDFVSENEKMGTKILRCLTLNGYLLPSVFFKKGYKCVEISEYRPRDFFRYKTILLYNRYSRDGLIVRLKRRKLFTLGARTLKMIFRLLLSYGRVSRDYHGRKDEITSFDFWYKHLGL